MNAALESFDNQTRGYVLGALHSGDWVVANALIEARALRGLDTTGMVLHFDDGTLVPPEIQANMIALLEGIGERWQEDGL